MLLLITSHPITAAVRSSVARNIIISREEGFEIWRSTEATAPPCRSVTEFRRLILNILVHSPHRQADGNCHLRDDLFDIVGVEFVLIDIDLAERIQHFDRKFEPL